MPAPMVAWLVGGEGGGRVRERMAHPKTKSESDRLIFGSPFALLASLSEPPLDTHASH